MNIRIILIALFVIFNALVYIFTQNNIQSKIDISQKNALQNLDINYKVFLQTSAQKADTIYEITINNSSLVEILSQAWNTQDQSLRDALRLRAYSLLEKLYDKLKNQGLLQYHFVFPDNRVFLRMHKVDKFGDDLSGVRSDFVKVNETKEVIRGFSQGKTAHAFRNVYPIYDKKGVHVASIEISFPSEGLQESLNLTSKIHSHFLVNQHIFDSKMWERDDRILEYRSSSEHPDYLITLSASHEKIDKVDNFRSRLLGLHEQIDANINNPQSFSLLSEFDNKYIIASFLPVFQNVDQSLAAWVVSYEEAPVIYDAKRNALLARLFSITLFGLLLFFVYKTHMQNFRLKRVLKSYDENVIYSTTDLKGKITDVSTAFEKISGYSRNELIGKNHNIIRHPDMPKELFKDLWHHLKNTQKWKGEIKNRRKDGSFYWVDAEIEPMFDDGQNHIGYSAVRQNISDEKEIQDVQREIIFTMGSIAENRSQETANHVRRVAEFSKILALKYGLSESEAEMLKEASPMHDIGKVAIPDSILVKPGGLSEQERQIINTHAQIGYELFKNSQRELLQTAAIVAHEHHEKWDGSGYPRGLKGEDIHIYGRITAVADVFDALGHERVYKKAWEDERVFAYMKEQSGKQFDPRLIEIFFENIEEILQVKERLRDSFS